jgi:hypothetical protein
MEHHIQRNTLNIIYKQIHGTSYTNKYMEHHIETYIENHLHTRNIIYKQMYGTSYTKKYIEHHTQTNAWNIIYKEKH